MNLAALLSAKVADVLDFPTPGIVFKDISPLLADHDGLTAVVQGLAAAGRDADGNTVVALEDGIAVLEVAPGVHVRFADAAVVRLLDEPAA